MAYIKSYSFLLCVFNFFVINTLLGSETLSVSGTKESSWNKLKNLTGGSASQSVKSKLSGVFSDDPSGQPSMGSFLAKTMANSMAAKLGIKNLAEVEKLIPLTEFLMNIPTIFPEAIMNSKYSDREFIIEHEKELEDKRIQKLVLMHDLQYEGAGDPSKPIGFVEHDGKYYFNPVSAVFTREIAGFNGSVEYIDLTDDKFQKMLLSALSLLGDVGKEIYKSTLRVLFLYPRDVFLLKLLSLITTAHRNSKEGTGYPRFAHLPMELTLFFSRLKLTPDFKATMARHKNIGEKVNKSFKWNKDEIIYFDKGPAIFMQSLPEAFRELINSVALHVNQEEIDEKEDREDLGISPVQLLVSKLRQTPGYNNRTTFIINKFLRLDFKDFTKTDQRLYIFAIKMHAAERYKALSEFTENFTFQSGGEIDLNVVPVDITRVIATLDNRVPQIITLIEDLIEKLEKDLTYFGLGGIKLIDTLDKEIEALKLLPEEIKKEVVALKEEVKSVADSHITSLDESRPNIERMGYLKEAVSKGRDLNKTIVELEAQRFKQFALGTEEMVALNLEKYLGLKYFQFMQFSNTRFRGDIDYIFNDIPLDRKDAISYSMAILLRVAQDIVKGTEKFKNDTTSYDMLSPEGKSVKIVGKELYDKTIKKKDAYIVQSKQKLQKMKSEYEAKDIKNSYLGALKKAKKINYLVDNLKDEFMHYLRQYKFDRRVKEPLLGKTLDDLVSLYGLGSLKTKQELEEEKIQKSLRNLIEQKGLFGSALIEKLSFNMALTFLQKISDKIAVKGFKELKQKAIDKNNQITASANSALVVVEKTIEALEKDISGFESKDTLTSIETVNYSASKDKLETNFDAKKDVEEVMAKANEISLLIKKQLEGLELAKKEISGLITLFKSKTSEAFSIDSAAVEKQLKEMTEGKASSDEILKYLIYGIVFKEFGEEKGVDLSNLQTLLTYAVELNINPEGSYSIEFVDEKLTLINSNLDEAKKYSFEKELLTDVAKLSENVKLNDLLVHVSNLLRIPDQIVLKEVFNSKDGLKGNIDEVKGVIALQGEMIEQLNAQEAKDKLLEESAKAIENLKNLTGGEIKSEEVDETGSKEEIIKITKEKKPYAETIDEFVKEEFTLLIMRSKEFAENGHLYINPMMREVLGMDMDDVIASYSQDERNLLSKDLEEMMEYEVSSEIDWHEEYVNKAINKDSFSEYVSLFDIPLEVEAADMDKELALLGALKAGSTAEMDFSGIEDGETGITIDSETNTNNNSEDFNSDLLVPVVLPQGSIPSESLKIEKIEEEVEETLVQPALSGRVLRGRTEVNDRRVGG